MPTFTIKPKQNCEWDMVALGDLIATENPLVLENLPPQ